MVDSEDIAFEERFGRTVSQDELKSTKALEQMIVIQKGAACPFSR